jgi:hypothetical protein
MSSCCRAMRASIASWLLVGLRGSSLVKSKLLRGGKLVERSIRYLMVESSEGLTQDEVQQHDMAWLDQ